MGFSFHKERFTLGKGSEMKAAPALVAGMIDNLRRYFRS